MGHKARGRSRKQFNGSLKVARWTETSWGELVCVQRS